MSQICAELPLLSQPLEINLLLPRYPLQQGRKTVCYKTRALLLLAGFLFTLQPITTLMLKKILLGALLIGLLAGFVIGWRFFMGNTNFEEKSKFFYIRTGHANYEEVSQSFSDSNFVKNPGSFNFLASRMEERCVRITPSL